MNATIDVVFDRSSRPAPRATGSLRSLRASANRSHRPTERTIDSLRSLRTSANGCPSVAELEVLAPSWRRRQDDATTTSKVAFTFKFTSTSTSNSTLAQR